MKGGEILLDPNNSAEERIQSAFQLMVEDTEETVAALISGLFHDPSPIVRHECGYCLGEVSNEKATNALVSAIDWDTNKFVIHEVALALSNRAIPLTRKYLEPLVDHQDENIALTGKICLQRFDLKTNNVDIFSAESPAEVILDHEMQEEMRIQAAFVLMEEGSNEAVQALIQALHSEPDPIVKHEIIFSLGETASRKAVPHLIEEMESDNNVFVVHEAALALGTLGDTRAKDPLERLLHHPDPDIVESAKIALERLQS